MDGDPGGTTAAPSACVPSLARKEARGGWVVELGGSTTVGGRRLENVYSRTRMSTFLIQVNLVVKHYNA